MGGIARPIIATATDTSAFEPDGTPRIPLGNVAEQAGYWTEKAGDTTKGYLPWNLPARWRLGNDLEALHQDMLNGSFPLNDRAKLEEWLAQRSNALTDSQKNWYEAVQGKPDTSTDKGLAQHIYTHTNSLLNPVNAELMSKFIQTRDPEVWKELHRNLTRTPERAETEQAQQKSLEQSQIVNFMTKNYGGGDYAEHMKSEGNPIDIASNLLPMVRGLRAGKAAAEAAVLAGKGTLKGSAAAIAKSAAINLGTGGVQTLVENPDATFADLAQAGKENIATALGLHAVGHVAGKAKALFTDLNDPRKARQVIDQLGAPNRQNTFKEALQLHEAEKSWPPPRRTTWKKRKALAALSPQTKAAFSTKPIPPWHGTRHATAAPCPPSPMRAGPFRIFRRKKPAARSMPMTPTAWHTHGAPSPSSVSMIWPLPRRTALSPPRRKGSSIASAKSSPPLPMAPNCPRARLQGMTRMPPIPPTVSGIHRKARSPITQQPTSLRLKRWLCLTMKSKPQRTVSKPTVMSMTDMDPK